MTTKYPRREKRRIGGTVFAIQPPDRETSKKMSRVRREKTEIELLLAKALRKNGIKYRSGKRHYGKPDFVLVGHKVAIFCDGDFWHGYDLQHRSIGRNAGFWQAKIARNIERDKEVSCALRRKGWLVIRLWEHTIKGDVTACIKRIRRTTTT